MNAIAPFAQFDGGRLIVEAWTKGIAPPPRELVWEWADHNVKLPKMSAAEGGDYDTGRTPYLREILTNLSPSSPVMSTILMKGSQIGASQAGLAFLLYVIAVAGGPALVVAPTIAMAELYSKSRLDPLIAECKEAAEKIPPNRGKNSGNTLRMKTFPGGMVRLTGANSANALKSMPVQWVLYEEPDEFKRDLEGQGNAIEMVRRRLTTYGRRAKEFANCTPGLKSQSLILPLFLTGDQREYTMPCPHCGKGTVFNKELFRHERGKPAGAHMVCMQEDCGKPIIEARDKEAMLNAGVWIPKIKDAPQNMPRSYYLPAFYSPVGWESWEAIALKIDQAEGNYENSKTVWNQIFGLPWTDTTDRPDPDEIHRRAIATSYRSRELPAEVLFLTAGVDVGGTHIEISIWGWGRDNRRYLIEHVRLPGKVTDPALWAEAEIVLQRGYLHPTGAVLKIRRVGVDRGKWPDIVVPWVRKQDPDWIVAVWGSRKIDAPLLKDARWILKTDDGQKHQTEFLYWMLGVGLLKLELYNNLNKPRAPGQADPGGVYLPNDVGMDYCTQLVSEEYVTVPGKGGVMKTSWERIGSTRAEALDCANYARAMAELVGWSHWTGADFDAAEATLRAEGEKLRREIARRQAARLARGDTRPVYPEDIVTDIAFPAGFARPEPEPAIEVPAPAPAPALAAPKPVAVAPPAAPSSIRIPRGLTNPPTPEGGIERPVEVGVPGRSPDQVDFRALMRGAGLGRSRSHDED
ncbi:phage terminase large subunit family protein [Methylobacterium ajmalii]|uniref:phage terminase large subunit family protein n=1 Tax=Methylobacterium ajmalii TaxID=2738439 RepID=UPI002F3330C7